MIKILDKHAKILEQESEIPLEIQQKAFDIVCDVKENGDKALFEMAKIYDHVELKSLEVSEDEMKVAYQQTDKEFLKVIEKAKNNIEDFHKHQLSNNFIVEKDGILLGQRTTPIERIGIYVPGGRALYPSTVLMNVIPAKIAGCEYICLTTPPTSDGSICNEILAISYMLGVDKVFKIGGAGAIAALAYGTETVKPVYKITGPGNAFVAAAKRIVFGKVGIDMIAGPSELLIIADQNQNPKFIAADMLSQAEHDSLARAILLTTSQDLAQNVATEIDIQLESLPKQEIARASIENQSMIIVADSLDECFELSNGLAPEHLEIMLDNAIDYLSKIKNAGSIFLGSFTPEAVGDYLAGVNHTLPTNQTAKFSSALSVESFVKKSTFVRYNESSLKSDANDIIQFARLEQLQAHARSVECRFN